MPIYSIDIHPDGTRLATGGQGRDSGLVMIWNTGAILDKNSENDENVPKVLCQVRVSSSYLGSECYIFILTVCNDFRSIVIWHASIVCDGAILASI